MKHTPQFSDAQLDLIKNIEKMIPDSGRQFYDMELAGMDVIELLDRAQKNQINIKLQGPTGSGKTTIYEAFCRKTKQPHFVSNMKGSTTSEELVGAFVPNEDEKGGAYIWKNGIIVRAALYSNLWIPVLVKEVVEENDKGFLEQTFVYDKEKEHYAIDIKNNEIVKEDIIETISETEFIVKAWPRCMLTIEEINFSPEELMSVWFSILDMRRNIILNEKNGEVITAGKFLSINATMNPDYVGTNELNEAMNDRFLIKLNVDYNQKIENLIMSELSKKYDFNFMDIKQLKFFVKKIRQGFAQEECSTNISTRAIESFLNTKGIFGEQIAKTSLVNVFCEEDKNFVKENFELAKSKSNTVNLTEQELDGLDLETFKSFKVDNKKTTAKKNKDIPF